LGVPPKRYPPVPGNIGAERFSNAVGKAFTASKEEIERRDAECQRACGKRSARKH
jgi:hypothetical protein